jgi:hypothetical protein
MGLARRAKGISEDVKALNDQSSQQAVDMMLSRADGLTEDAVSAKAIQGVKVSLLTRKRSLSVLMVYRRI